MSRPLDVLVVGAGPAGLATAIRLRQQLDEAGSSASIAVIDKAPQPGYHNLSGSVVDTAPLDELTPEWRKHRFLARHVEEIERDDMYFLLGRRAIKVPHSVVPKGMDHSGDVVVAISCLANYFTLFAEEAGIEVYHGFSARELILEGGRVAGVRLGEVGLDADGGQMPNYRPAEEIRARVTVLADGTHGVLSTQLREQFGEGANPQVYSLGMRAVMRFREEHPFGAERVAHFLGYPNPSSVFGGGFIYSMDANRLAVGLILALDWKYGDLNPQLEFERFRKHPFVADLLKGGVTVATGARTIPEGGYYALGKVSVPGALVVGDSAGFVNMEKIKGIHNAIWSGMAAAETIAAGLAEAGTAEVALEGYQERLEERGVLPEMRHARNYRQVFRWGLYPGAPLSQIAHLIPGRIGIEADREGTKRGARLHREDPGGMDGATFVSLSGALHREDEAAHMTILDSAKCLTCAEDYANSCTSFCPGQVYRWDGEKVVLSPSNCLHCMACSVKCPLDNIHWQPPEGGEGPRFAHR
ncbi:MAG: electron-transfer flavoprotein:ubiquinone oxidoreductase [Chloroflexota bacterium]|nr:electron-transfer flavoprotein:ubiquinone oxidoreductase [Chloroflexota bacterium]